MKLSSKLSNDMLKDLEFEKLSEQSLKRLILTLHWINDKNYQQIKTLETELKKAQLYTADLFTQINLKNEELEKAKNHFTSKQANRRKYSSSRL